MGRFRESDGITASRESASVLTSCMILAPALHVQSLAVGTRHARAATLRSQVTGCPGAFSHFDRLGSCMAQDSLYIGTPHVRSVRMASPYACLQGTALVPSAWHRLWHHAEHLGRFPRYRTTFKLTWPAPRERPDWVCKRCFFSQ